MPGIPILNQESTSRRLLRALREDKPGQKRDWELTLKNWPEDFVAAEALRKKRKIDYPQGFNPNNQFAPSKSMGNVASQPIIPLSLDSDSEGDSDTSHAETEMDARGSNGKQTKASSKQSKQTTPTSKAIKSPTSKPIKAAKKQSKQDDASAEQDNDSSPDTLQAKGRQAKVGGMSSLSSRWKPIATKQAFKPIEPGANEILIGTWKGDTSIRRIVTARISTEGQVEYQLRDFTGELQELEPAESDQSRVPSNNPVKMAFKHMRGLVDWSIDITNMNENGFMNLICETTDNQGHPWINADDVHSMKDLGALWRLVESKNHPSDLYRPYNYNPARSIAAISQAMAELNNQVENHKKALASLAHSASSSVDILSPAKQIDDLLKGIWQGTFNIQSILLENRRRTFNPAVNADIPQQVIDWFNMKKTEGGYLDWTEGAFEEAIQAAKAKHQLEEQARQALAKSQGN